MRQRVGEPEGEPVEGRGEAGGSGQDVGPVGQHGDAVDLGQVESAQSGQRAARGHGAVHGGEEMEAAREVAAEGEHVPRVANAFGMAAQALRVGVGGAEHGQRDRSGLDGDRFVGRPVAEDPGTPAGVVQGTALGRAPHRGRRGPGFGVRKDHEPGPRVTAHRPVPQGAR